MDTRRFFHLAKIALLGSCIVSSAYAGLTDIGNSPLVTSATSNVLPNVMFIIDDSGSMDWDYMPDLVNDNYCRTTTGSFDMPCCSSSESTGSGSGSGACWYNSTSTAAPFGTWRAHPPFLSGQFNGVAYNPAITYTPPLKGDGSSYPTMNSANTGNWGTVKNDAYDVQNTKSTNMLTNFPDLEWCTDTGYTDCLRNDNYVLPGVVNGKTYKTFHATTATGSGFVGTGSLTAPTTAARTFGPHFYTIIPGEYCDSPNLRNCQYTADSTFSYPAPLRWCNSAANSVAATANPTASATLCQATKTDVYKYLRYPTKFYTPQINPVKAQAKMTFTLSGTCNATNKVAVTAVTVNGVNILSGTTSSETTSSNIANAVYQKVDAARTGYTATRSSNLVTLFGTLAQGNITYGVTTTYSKTGTLCNLAVTPSPLNFSGGVTGPIPAQYYGSFLRTDIIPANNSYPYPGTATKANTRTDCGSASTCTYEQEMTNFANWWTYYHSRMQMMKSSASLSFSTIDSRFRVGFMSINNATSSDFLNLASFEGTQKNDWYAKLIRTKPSGGTPLRTALTTAGRFYGGMLNGGKINNVSVVDPMQYSCQQNFTILSTDGFWNDADGSGKKLDGSTAIANEDGSMPRPQYDGTGTGGALSDVAAYYYATDLRTDKCTGSPVPPATAGNDVCTNNVPVSGQDAAAHQHMTTFTVGLGASGYMQYSSGYTSASSGDYFDIKNGTTANPAAGICSWQASGACNWPTPVKDTQTAIDDLWHTAVNGYGTYFSAGNPAVLSAGLTSALAGVSARTGASSAATTSNPNIATGDNFLFSSTFTSKYWDGEMVRNQLDLETGAVSGAEDWSAQALLDTNAARKIYTYSPADTNRLKEFKWDNLSATERAFFTTPNISSLSQFCGSGVTCLGASEQAAASGANLVEFIRGVRTYEGVETDLTKYYHQRQHVLGDIVNSEAVYTKTPVYNYTDPGYADFKSAQSSRQGMVYVGANDGMLHAFNASTGVETWAYVPSSVLPSLYKIADKNYSALHRYSVDGTVVQGDIFYDGAWRTIIVGGLNAGGRGYYALDVTDPNTPKALWEFTYDTTKGTGYTTDANLGFTFGKAEISKLKNGTWVVLVTSGYNNVSPGDGKGYLYVLNAGSGAKVSSPISTNAGNTTTPSGLAQIRTWAENGDTDNVAARVYGGDVLGNVWRFDVDDNLGAAGNEAQAIATLTGSSGAVQSVTAKPELGLVDGYPVVYVGTGRYLGVSDLTDSSPQSIYAIKDNLASSNYGSPRSNGNFIKQTLTAGSCPYGSPVTICTTGQLVRTSTSLAVNLAINNGWYVDLIDTGERSNNDPQLALGTLVVTTNVPNASACSIGGYSYIYFFDYKTGGPVSTSTTQVSGKALGNTLATRPVVAKLPNNKVIAITQLSDGSKSVTDVPTGQQANQVRRVSWRELIAE